LEGVGEELPDEENGDGIRKMIFFFGFALWIRRNFGDGLPPAGVVKRGAEGVLGKE
jgi:hypothetical protein